MPNVTLIFENQQKIILCEHGVSIADILIKCGIFFDFPCGGSGRCGKCIVKISGDVTPPEKEEISLLDVNRIQEGYRLACRTRIIGDVTIFLPKSNLIAPETDSAKNLNGHSKLSETTHEKIGIAADIGTTTLVLKFFNLESSSEIETVSLINPQRQYGADVISRIEASEKFGVKKLQRVLIDALNTLISEFCTNYNTNKNNITECVFAGNTIMQHIAAGISPHGMASSPFTPSTLFGENIKASELGLFINESADVHFSKCISSFVGGDIMSGLLACRFDNLNTPALFIDIGTNGETALFDGKGNIICTSAAAGPALEGAHISCGVGNIPGAIFKVEPKSGKLVCKTIDDKDPVGICGTGLIDTVAALLELDYVDETGAIAPSRDSGQKKEQCYYLCGSDIYISQKDLREVQAAKSAIVSSVYSLLDTAGIRADALADVYVAGGLGTGLNIKSACRIGLLPPEFEKKATSVGNSALSGASMLLLDKNNFKRVKKIDAMCHTLDLSLSESFNRYFIENMLF